MKKFVHSRWKDCPRACFADDVEMNGIVRSESRFFSKSEQTRRTTTLQNPVASSEDEDMADCFSRAQVASKQMKRGVSCQKSKAPIKVEDDKSSVFARPNSTYGDLIRDVYREEGRVVMRQCDIVKRLKANYPYFGTLRRLDSCVAQALHKSKRFVRISPGTWKLTYQRSYQVLSKQRDKEQKKDFRNKQKESHSLTPSKAGKCGRFHGSSARLQRCRKRPDFLNIEWNRYPLKDTPGKQEEIESEFRRHEEEKKPGKANDETTDSEATSTSEFEVHSNTSPGLPTMIEPKVEHTEPEDDAERLKDMLKQYNDEILKKAMDKIAKENEKYLERMMATLSDIRVQRSNSNECGSSRTKRIFEKDCSKHNKNVLEDVINQIISQNQKCLDALSAESEALKGKIRPWRTNQSFGDGAGPVNNSICNGRVENCTSLESRDKKFSQAIYKSPLIPVSVSKPSTSHSGQVTITPKILKYPLPVLNRPNHRQSNHIRLGKRVFPRLKQSSKTFPVTKQEKDCVKKEPESNWKTSSEFHVTDSTKRCPERTNSPVTASTSSVRQLFETATPPGCSSGTNDEELQSSVDTAFAEFARNNTELDDIVALIDPSLASSNKKKARLAENTTHASVETNQCSCDRQQPKLGVEQSDAASSECGEPPAFQSSPSKDKSTNTLSQMKDVGATYNKKPVTEVGECSPATPKIQSIFSKAKAGNTQKASQTSGRFLKISPNMINAQNTSKPDVEVRLSNRTLWKSYKIRKSSVEPAASYPTTQTGKPLNYRYVPPYRWGIHNNLTQSTHIIQTRPSVVIAPRYVMYSPVRSGFARFAPPVDQFVTHSARPGTTMQQFHLSKPDVRCRIRGAQVFRFPVIK